MGMTLRGLGALKTELHNIAEKVPENGRKVMHRGADKIVERAKLFTPHDTGALENSIRQEAGYEGRGRLTIMITFGGESDGVDTDAYAMEIHENYDRLHPGPGTLLKMEANPGVDIGDHFLTRAVEEQEPKLEKAMIEAVTSTIEEGWK